MSTIDINKPFVAYTLMTSCANEKTIVYQLNEGILLREDGEWQTGEMSRISRLIS